jgi:hypothetical protein
MDQQPPSLDLYPDLFEFYPPELAPDHGRRRDPQLAPDQRYRSTQLLAIDAHNARHAALYYAVRYILSDRFQIGMVANGDGRKLLIPDLPSDGGVGSPQGVDLFPLAGTSAVEWDHLRATVVGVLGLLIADNITDPLLGKDETTLSTPDGDIQARDLNGKTVQMVGRFIELVVGAVQEFNAASPLFRRVFPILHSEGFDSSARPLPTYSLVARQYAEVTRILATARRDAGDSQLPLLVRSALAQVRGGTIDGRSSSIDVEFIDLDNGTSATIIKDNVLALASIYRTAMLEDLKYFAVADKVAEHFTSGMLPIQRGAGADSVYQYIREAVRRMTEIERRSLYARSLGVAQGSVDEPMVNREFMDQWMRFLSAVSQSYREFSSFGVKSVTQEQVFKTARDLGVGLSLHGFGFAHPAAVELQALIRTVKDMLSYPDVLAAYGTQDIWQLVERVSSLYLGGAANGVRQRTMAQSGFLIIQWLALKAPALSSPYASDILGLQPAALLNQQQTRSAPATPFGVAPVLPQPPDIVSNVERWLAVTGTDDTSILKMSQPVSLSMQPTIPDLTPQAATDSLREAMSRFGNLSAMSPATMPKA